MSLRSRPFSRSLVQTPVLALSLAAGWGGAWAQTLPEPQNVVQLSATAQQEVVQDWLTAILVVRHQAPDAGTVQNQLKASLTSGLAHAKPRAAQAGLDLSTGAFHVQPRYSRDGQIIGWQGSAELLIQGRDVAQVAALAGNTPGWVVSQLQFSVSREASQRLQAEVRQQAIAQFRANATQVAQDFGFNHYTLREVSVSEAGAVPPGRPKVLMLAEARADLASAPVPAEPGKSLVQVTVSGSVQLR